MPACYDAAELRGDVTQVLAALDLTERSTGSARVDFSGRALGSCFCGHRKGRQRIFMETPEPPSSFRPHPPVGTPCRCQGRGRNSRPTSTRSRARRARNLIRLRTSPWQVGGDGALQDIKLHTLHMLQGGGGGWEWGDRIISIP
jgi:hypothetical protein